MNGIVASAAHLAYHLGAIRQTRSTVRHAVHRRMTDFLPMGSRGDQSWTGAVLSSEDAGRWRERSSYNSKSCQEPQICISAGKQEPQD
jgi:hypothetical protein